MTDDSPHSVGIKPKSCVFGGDSMCTYKYVYVLYTHMCVFLCVFAPRSFCLIMSAPHAAPHHRGGKSRLFMLSLSFYLIMLFILCQTYPNHRHAQSLVTKNIMSVSLFFKNNTYTNKLSTLN